jgi:CBS-domain-containing membrane protein
MCGDDEEEAVVSTLVHLGRTAAAGAELATRKENEAVVAVPGLITERNHRPVLAADVMARLPLAVHRSATLWTAWDRLHRARQQHLVVVDDHQRAIGVLDERTIALEWPSGPLGAHRLPVHTLLRGRVRPRVRSEDVLATVTRVMVGAQVDAVPVVDRSGRLFGLVTLWHFAQIAAPGTATGRASEREPDARPCP